MNKTLAPGLLLAFFAAGLAFLINYFVPQLSALLVAILLGVAVTNTVTLPPTVAPGQAVATKRVLRIGIVLLGFQISLVDIAALGWGMILAVITIVAGGFAAAILIGRFLGLRLTQSVLIGAGFSICGAAAVAAVETNLDEREDDEVVTALGLVVVFGTLMIGVIPLAVSVFGFTERLGGLWAGGSIHEVAQVVAAAGIIGPAALQAGVIVKLARVLMLAPLIAAIGLWQRSGRAANSSTPLIPLFIVGFLIAAVARTTGWLPAGLLDGLRVAQTLFLSAAMFALGCGVRFATLKSVGGKPVILATLVTLVVTAIALVGAWLAQ